MKIHILGICGTFMAGIAILAKQLGHEVTGSDDGVYPPMSTQLAEQGISCITGYDPSQLQIKPDLIIIGNALSRGNPTVEAILNQGFRYISAPQWLAEQVLENRWVIAIAGTHGKTTTTSMLTWILEYAQLNPSFLIGGVPENFGVSAKLTDGHFFVVEADEYDSAFFDKRSKFIHYRPRTLVLNNLEFDHADIFADLATIQRQFHYLIRNVPSEGRIVMGQEYSLQQVVTQGCWTQIETIDTPHSDWYAISQANDYSRFEVYYRSEPKCVVNWQLYGRHNMRNALAAMAAAHHAGVPIRIASEALAQFRPAKRRLELRGEVGGIFVYDDFAHHPTAIAVTLEALKRHIAPQSRVIAVLEPRSNSMKMGVFQDQLAPALSGADAVMLYQPQQLKWSLQKVADNLQNAFIFNSISGLLEHLAEYLRAGDHVLIMSNGSFENVHQRLLEVLKTGFLNE